MRRNRWTLVALVVGVALIFPASIVLADRQDSSTYDPPMPQRHVAVTNACLDAFADSREEVADWHRVSYLGMSDGVKEVLGKSSGTSLDKLFHVDLRTYLKPYDKYPGLLISPDGSSAVALFFHADNTVSVIRLTVKGNTWSVVGETVDALAVDAPQTE